MSEAAITQYLAKALKKPEDDPTLDYDIPNCAKILPESPRPAAVLMPLLTHNNTWHLLLTRRNSNLQEHSGQVAFPGGRMDVQDASPEQAALREAYEEIGLHPKDVRILGRLRQIRTVTNYNVTPVVAAIPWPYPLRPQAEEVSRIFTIPLNWLADPTNYELHQHRLPTPFDSVSVIYFHPYDGEILWGASARFTLTLLRALYQNGNPPAAPDS